VSYKVTIERTEVRKVIQRPEWVKIGEKEVPREAILGGTRIESVMGHTPEIEVRKEVTEKMLEVTVDELDLHRVVAAALGMNGGAK
jgi:hypothetical protein